MTERSNMRITTSHQCSDYPFRPLNLRVRGLQHEDMEIDERITTSKP